MQKSSLPPIDAGEKERLKLLHSYHILDSPPEVPFDQLVTLAATTLDAPIALIGFVDHYRLWCKARIGLPELELPRDAVFCSHAIQGAAPLVIEDAAADPRFCKSPLVCGPLGVRAYAGMPILSAAVGAGLDPTASADAIGSPLALGTVAVMYPAARRFLPAELETLRLLAAQAVALLDGRRTIDWLRDILADVRTEESGAVEAERRASEERFRVLFEHSSEAHLLFGEAGIIDCNFAAVALLRCRDKQELLSLHPAQLSPPLQPDGRLSMEKCIETDALARKKGFHRFDWLHRRLDGSEFLVEVTLTPVTLRRRPAMLAVWHDLTERKHVEDALRSAKEAAEAAAQAKGDFLATVSHELRTPLNGVMGMTTLLLNGELGEQQRRYALTVRSCGEALLAMINDVLDFTRMEDGKLEVARVPFSPRELVNECLSAGHDSARQKGLRLTALVGADVPDRLLGDPGRIGQILHNLMVNAVKFTDCGEVRLLATAQPVKPGQAVPGLTQVRLRLAVWDTGIGIPQEARGRLFQAFTQLDGSMTRKYGGTGLGLAICRRLADAMGGVMSLDSEVGRGSEFSLELALPLAAQQIGRPSDELELTDELTDESGAGTGQGTGGGKELVVAPAAATRQTSDQAESESWELHPLPRTSQILIVDDNGVNALVVGAMLEKMGCLSQVAQNGPEALDILERRRFDLVLMDCQMPGMDGFELTRRLRQDGRLTCLPIVALTANAQVGDRERCLAAGMDDYLTKPVRVNELRDAIERWA